MGPLAVAALTGLSLGGMYLFKPKAPPPPAPNGRRELWLDEGIGEGDFNAVTQAILYGVDPAALGHLAADLAARGLPCAGHEVAVRAWELAGGTRSGMPRPVRTGPCGAPSPAAVASGAAPAPVPPEIAAQACAMIDPGLDPATGGAVVTALASEPDPGKLDAFAGTLDGTHPRAAAFLRAKARVLRGELTPAAHAGAGHLDVTASPTAAPATFPTISPDVAADPAVQAAACEAVADIEGVRARADDLEGGDDASSVAEQAVAQAAGVVGAPAAQAGQTARPTGHWFVAVRSKDTPHPATLAKIGSSARGPGPLAELAALNPHLVQSGALRSFRPGDEVNVPGTWMENLVRKGFKVRRD